MADEENTEEEAGGGGKKKLIIMIVGALVLVGGAVGGTLMFVGGGEDVAADAEAVEPPKDYGYMKLTKPIVLNYKAENGKTRFLKTELTLMTENESGLDDIEKHLPKIQHTISVVFGRQAFESLLTNEGKEAMRLEALTEVQTQLKDKLDGATIDDIYFTTFVTQ